MNDTTVATPPEPGSVLRPSGTWRRSLVVAAVAYVFSRLCVLAGAGIISSFRTVIEAEDGTPRPRNAVGHILDVLTSWDGLWYFRIVRDGYPTQIPENVSFHVLEARAAFFPVYPTVVRWLDVVLPGGDVLAGVVLNAILGAVFVVLVGVLARDIAGPVVAERSMILTAMFPGSFVLLFTYSEASLLIVAAGCLIALGRRQWVLAGVLAAVGGATRPNGIALVVACAVACLIAVRDRREWGSIVAVVLAPLGFIGFHLFLWQHTGEIDAWFRVQREAWDEGASFGLSAITGTWEAFTHPLSSPTDLITALSTVAAVVLCVGAWKRRLPAHVIGYTVVVLALMILPETVTARPRFLYTAFPLLISLAAWIPTRNDEHADDWQHVWTLLLAACAAGLVTLTGLYGSFGAIP